MNMLNIRLENKFICNPHQHKIFLIGFTFFIGRQKINIDNNNKINYISEKLSIENEESSKSSNQITKDLPNKKYNKTPR